MLTKPTILKFGGTSVEDAAAFARVREIVRAHADQAPIVVVSAMSRVTDALVEIVQSTFDENRQSDSLRLLEAHLDRHRAVAAELLSSNSNVIESALQKAHIEIVELLARARMHPAMRPLSHDVIVSQGERLAATLLTAVLQHGELAASYVDARRCIVTTEDHGNAAPLMEQSTRRTRVELLPLLERREIPVLGGFIAATESGATTLLGRGGSDYTAAIIGAALAAREIQIWTDVTGVLTADPRIVPAARTVPRLSYMEAAELAYFGAKVLHPKTVQPAVEDRIPLRILNSRRPHETGTLVNSDSEATPGTIKAIAHKKKITTVQITSARMLGSYGFLHRLFEIFNEHRTVIDVVATSEVSVLLTLDDAQRLPDALAELRALGTVEVHRERALIGVVGEGLRATPGIAARVFNTLADINIQLISQGASSVNLTFVVDEAQAIEVVARLHKTFFESSVEEFSNKQRAVSSEQ